jgi:hypothetical protein
MLQLLPSCRLLREVRRVPMVTALGRVVGELQRTMRRLYLADASRREAYSLRSGIDSGLSAAAALVRFQAGGGRAPPPLGSSRTCADCKRMKPQLAQVSGKASLLLSTVSLSPTVSSATRSSHPCHCSCPQNGQLIRASRLLRKSKMCFTATQPDRLVGEGATAGAAALSVLFALAPTWAARRSA